MIQRIQRSAMIPWPRRSHGALLLIPCALVLAAAAPSPLKVQVADSGPLTGNTTPSVVAAAPAKPVLVTPAGLEPAPVPDPDVGAPLASGVKGASLAPAFFSQKAEFAGDGYVGKSSESDTVERRRQPAAGFNLSLPVQQ